MFDISEIGEAPKPPPVPPVVKWYRAYCFATSGIGALIYGVGGWWLWQVGNQVDDPAFDKSQFEKLLVVMLASGTFFTITNFLAGFIPVKPWAWYAALTNLILGAISVVCLPLSLPVLIYWIREDVRRYFVV